MSGKSSSPSSLGEGDHAQHGGGAAAQTAGRADGKRALGRCAPTPPPPAAVPLPSKAGEEKLSLPAAFATIADHWHPRVAATANGQDIRLVKTHGTFPWHSHADADEVFLCWRGQFRIEFRDRLVTLGPGELLVVPRGTEHRTASNAEAQVLIFEPSEVVNTGDATPSTFTAERTTLA